MADSKGYQFFQNRQCEYFPCHEVEKEEDFEEVMNRVVNVFRRIDDKSEVSYKFALNA